MSARIELIVSKIRKNAHLFDMCCDHGLIGTLFLEKDPDGFVVFVDQSGKALQSLRLRVQDLAAKDRDRFEIREQSAETMRMDIPRADFVIAGVGVWTIMTIIGTLFPFGLDDHRLILGPQQNSEPLRTFLKEKGFVVIEEESVLERGRVREILVVEKR